MRKSYLLGAVGSWLLAPACGRLGTGDDMGDGDTSVSIGDGDAGDGDAGDGDVGDGDVGDGDVGDGDVGDGDVGDGDGDGDLGGGPGDGDGDVGDGDVGDGDVGDGDVGDGDATGGLGGMPTGDGDGDVEPPEPGLPTCTITAPEEGATTAFHGELVPRSSQDPATDIFTGITFRATATDPEDGDLEGESIVWYIEGAGVSAGDAPLGFGRELTVDTLPPGENKIICHALDSEDNLGTDHVTLKVVSPVVYIHHPIATNGIRPAAEAIEFVAAGYDYEDGVLNPETFFWESSLDGVLGQGNGAYKLSAGMHQVVVEARDEAENIAIASVTVTTVAVDVLPPID